MEIMKTEIRSDVYDAMTRDVFRRLYNDGKIKDKDCRDTLAAYATEIRWMVFTQRETQIVEKEEKRPTRAITDKEREYIAALKDRILRNRGSVR